MKDLGGSVVLRRIGLVVGLFVLFGLAASLNYSMNEIRAIYSLQEGLTALATYGVILIVNEELMRYGKESLKHFTDIHDERIVFISYFGASVGINLLALPLIYIIINSEFFEGISVGIIYTFLSLVLPIILPQAFVLSRLLSVIIELREELKSSVIEMFGIFYFGPTIWLLMNHRPSTGIVTLYLLWIGVLLSIVYGISRKYHPQPES